MKNFCLFPHDLASRKQLRYKALALAVIFITFVAPFKLFAQAPALSYSGPQTYIAGTVIAALAPTISGGTVAAPGYSSGPVTLGSGFSSPFGVAADAAGNVYVADLGNGAVKKIPSGTGAPVTIGSGFSLPQGIAVDAAGNIYVADGGNHAVTEIPAGGGAQVTLASGLGNPAAVAVDGMGNVYVADEGNNVVKDIPVNGGAPVTLGSGFSHPSGIAVDAAGNVYVADEGNNALKEIPVAGGSPVTITSWSGEPFGVAVDASGNLYVAANGNNVYKIPVGGGASFSIGGTGFISPNGIAVDASGNVYVADPSNSLVQEIKPAGGYYLGAALPAGLSFDGSTGIISGTPTTASPATNYVITAYNSLGHNSATVNITVNAIVFSYSSPQTYTAGTAITALAPTIVAGSVAVPGYSSIPATLGSGFSSPFGVAADASGNVYVADLGSGAVKKIPLGAGAPVTIGSGFSLPQGIAVDAAGNIYVADGGDHAVTEIPVGGGAQVTLASGLGNPAGVAVDGMGNVYVADEGNNVVKEIPVNGGAPVTLGSGFSRPSGIAVDAAGNVYVADEGNNAVKEIPVAGGSPVTITSWSGEPFGVAVDASGNLYVAAHGNTLYKIPAGGGASFSIGGAGFNSPNAIAVDASGNVYVADPAIDAVDEIKPTGGYYSGAALPAGLNLDGSTGIISGAPTAAGGGPAANYTITAYNNFGHNSATINITVNALPPPSFSYSSPQNYTAGTAIAALAPTIRSGTVAAPGYSGSPVTLGSGFSSPFGVAIDAAGNVYVADRENNAVKKIPLVSGSYGPPVIFGSGFSSPGGIAADAAGNIYVTDSGNSEVKEIPANGGAITILGSGFSSPLGIAVDAAGNVYVSDFNTNSVKKIAAGGSVTVTLATGFNQPAGVAVDAAGNVYVADLGNNAVKKIPVAGGGPVRIGSGFSSPGGVAIDAAGNVYIADYGNNALKEIPAVGGSPASIASGSGKPFGVAVDAAGNLYVAYPDINTIEEIMPVGGYYLSAALPAGLSFDGSTGIISGTPTTVWGSPATNYTITAYNSAGSGTAAVNITVNALPLPVISYSSPQTYTAGTAITALAPTVVGGTVAAPGYSSSTVNIGSGFLFPTGVAVDAAGNVYVADRGAHAVKKIPLGTGDPFTVGSGFSSPTGVAVDAAGNVYVTDSGNNNVTEIPANGSTAVILGSGFLSPAGVAVDAAGNVYVADEGNHAVKKIPAGGGVPFILASGFSNPTGVAVDASGNVYVADAGNNVVNEIPAGGGALVTFSSGFSGEPVGIAVDAAGNVYVSVAGGTVEKIFAGGGAAFSISGTVFNEPFGVAVDASGNVYVAEEGTPSVMEIKPVGGYYLSAALPAGLSFDGSTGIIGGTPTTASPATNYTITAYNSFGGNSATINITVNALPPPSISYSSPQTYTAGTAITALAPTTVGAPAAAPGYSGSPVTLGSGFSSPFGVTTDAAGNVYVADRENNAIEKIPLAGGSYGTPVIFGSGFSSPGGVAADAAGNIYVTDSGNSEVKEIPANGGAITFLGSGFSAPLGIAVDVAGNVYVSDFNTNSVKKIVAGSGATVTLATGFNEPAGVAVDAAGNVYVADLGNNAVKEIPVAGGGPVSIGSGFSSPGGVAIDAAGNVYVADYGNGALKEIPVAGSSPVTIAPGSGKPFGVATDAAGNLYVVDPDINAVKKIMPVGGYYLSTALPAGLSFDGSTGIISGTPTVAGPATNYTVTAYNGAGSSAAAVDIKVVPKLSNAYLSFIGLTHGYNTFSPGFAKTTTGYTETVANNIDSIAVRTIANDPNATVAINGTAAKSGSYGGNIPLSFGPNTIKIVVTAQDGTTTMTYTVTVTRMTSNNANLAFIGLNHGYSTISPVFVKTTTSYAESVASTIDSIEVRPVANDTTATITVNGAAAKSGVYCANLPLSFGPNVISIVVKAQDGFTTLTYTVTVTRALSNNAYLSFIGLNHGYDTFSPVFVKTTPSYTETVAPTIDSVEVRPVLNDPTATVMVNGTAATSGSYGKNIGLSIGQNTINIVVKAQDGSTTMTYTVIVTRPLSSNAYLSFIGLNHGYDTFSPVFAKFTTSYTETVPLSIDSIEVRPVLDDTTATVTVNGTTATSGSYGKNIGLSIGQNTINIVVKAQDGSTMLTYIVTVTRAAAPGDNALYEPVSVVKPKDSVTIENDGIIVHQGVSPNGDGINDFLLIEGITNYPDNHLMIINRNGALVYQTKGYDNSTRIFDGHSNINGSMQLPGTYFYSLDYTIKGETKHKTGFLVLKY